MNKVKTWKTLTIKKHIGLGAQLRGRTNLLYSMPWALWLLPEKEKRKKSEKEEKGKEEEEEERKRNEMGEK